MMANEGEMSASLRWSIYVLLFALALGNMTGRLMSVNAVNRSEMEQHLRNRELRAVEKQLEQQGLTADQLEAELAQAKDRIDREIQRQRPFLSANDRSRWLAIRALVEQGTFQIDGLIDRHVWNTIDMVQHEGTDGELHLYSSKPPLLIVLIAGEYWLLNKTTGMTLGEQPYLLGRVMLLTTNVLPMLLLLAIVASLAERWGTTDWSRIFVVASACFATFLSTFVVVLNNHLIAAVSAAVTVYAWTRIRCDDDHHPRWYALAGIAAAFTAANELPALAFFALIALDLFRVNRKSWLTGFLPAAGIVVIAFFATNYLAHQSLRPPYMHRSTTDPADNWYDYSYTVDGREIDSYWRDRQGMDRGEPSKWTYALHVLIGHHGVFSLTPIWIMSFVGLFFWIKEGSGLKKEFAWGVVLLSVICLIFFIGLRPIQDRNYGGMTSGFRWMFWFAPLWLVAILPAADWASRTVGRKALACVLLSFSVLSASYPTWNPWTQPWLYRWLEFCGWQGF